MTTFIHQSENRHAYIKEISGYYYAILGQVKFPDDNVVIKPYKTFRGAQKKLNEMGFFAELF